MRMGGRIILGMGRGMGRRCWGVCWGDFVGWAFVLRLGEVMAVRGTTRSI